MRARLIWGVSQTRVDDIIVSKAYLEPNAINWSRRSGWTGAELRSRLESRGIEPHFGIHGIYELARGFLSDEHKTVAAEHFQILADLEPVFDPTPEMLFAKELDHLRTGASVIPILDELNRTSAKQQVALMAGGRLEDKGSQFIRHREADIRHDHPRYIAKQLEQVRALVASRAGRPTTFDDALDLFDSEVPEIIRQLLGYQVTASEAVELHSRLDQFPAIRSTVRANLYMWAAPLVSGSGVSTDKNDDYRHVIEASYANVFVTGDIQLARTVPRLHPELQVLAWSTIAAG